MIRTLVISGTNNHDYERSTPFCKSILEGTGNFDVVVTNEPDKDLQDADRCEQYDLFLVDYNGPDWSKESKTNFIRAIQRGTGVCILHAANNAFTGWKEYEDLCVFMWRETGGHGQYHKFDVEVVNPDHPVTRGLPEVMKDHPDELYHGLTHMHNAPHEVLATAHSSTESGGSGKTEPMVVVRDYGKGRMFHCILGHVWREGVMDTFESKDFQKLLINGCEWAARAAEGI